MDNVDELKIVRVGKEIPKGFELVETGDKNDLSDETIDALALKAIKDGTIRIVRKVQGDEERKDEPKKEANLGDFIGAMGGLMAAFAPGEEGQQIQKEVNQMAAMFGASPDSKKKDESKKEADLGDVMGAMGGLMAALAPQQKPHSNNVTNVDEVDDKEIVGEDNNVTNVDEVVDKDIAGEDNKLGMTTLSVPQLLAAKGILSQWVRLEQSKCGELLISTEYLPSEAIHLSVIKARDLMYGKADPKANPYVKVTFGKQTAKSPTIENNQHPDWNYNVYLDILKDSPEEVIIEIFDEMGFTKEEKSKMPATVTFIFRPKQEAFLVEIAGSFNDWSKVAMAKDGGHWRVSLRMKPGRHQYKYIVDGKWQHDENLPLCDDKHGGCNNVINVDYEDDYKMCPNGHPLESKIGSDPERLHYIGVINCNICLDCEMPNHEIQEGDQRHSCVRCNYDLCDGCYNTTEAVVTAFGMPAVDQRASLGTFIRSPEYHKNVEDRVPVYWKGRGSTKEQLWLDIQDCTPIWRVYTYTREEGKSSGCALKHSSEVIVDSIVDSTGVSMRLKDPYETYLPPKTGWMFYSSSGEWIKDDTIEVLLNGARKSNILFVESSGGSIPPNAFSAGKDENGETLYVGRAKHHSSLIPGKFEPSAGVVYVSFGGKEHAKHKYEVLVQEGNADNLRWISASVFHHVILGAVRCGYEDTGSPLFVARAKIGEQRVIGKVGVQERKCWMPLNGREVEIYSDIDYEVLCCNELAVNEYNSDGVLSTKKEEADQDEEDSSAEAGNKDGNTVQCAQQ